MMKEGPRTLSKYVEGIVINYAQSGTAFTIASTSPATGWINKGNGVFHWQGFIDISGYRLKNSDMVIVPTAVTCQYGAGWYSSVGLKAGGQVTMQYAVTTDKIDDLDYGALGQAEPLAGFIGDNSEMEQVIYAATEVWGPAANSYGMTNLQKMVYGEPSVIVGPRIYIAIRMALSPGVNHFSESVTNPGTGITTTQPQVANTDTVYFIPPMRFLIGGEATEIPEYQLMHYMKRSIDVQQTPDID